MRQKKLIGEGEEERLVLVEKVGKVMQAIFRGDDWEHRVWEEAVRELCRDILRERARLGGDWAVAGVLFNPRWQMLGEHRKVTISPKGRVTNICYLLRIQFCRDLSAVEKRFQTRCVNHRHIVT